MNKISATVVADSINPQGDRLTSLLITFPRILLSEINTHRMLSKNTSSSRAIPFKKMVEAVQNDPFIPIAWQKQHSGMQGSEYLDTLKSHIAKEHWLKARDNAILEATLMNRYQVTKQLCNRLLEPFMWTTMLITGSKEGWQNFFELRCPSYQGIDDIPFKSKKEYVVSLNEKPNQLTSPIQVNDYSELEWLKLNKGQAEIHIMELAEQVYDAMNESTPEQLKAGEWHIPFEDKMHFWGAEYFPALFGNPTQEEKNILKVKISTAMAARTSYTIVGDEKEINYSKMIELHDRLLSQEPPHSSPLEHTAQVPTQYEYDMALKGEEKGWFRNYKGFKSYRQIIEESK